MTQHLKNTTGRFLLLLSVASIALGACSSEKESDAVEASGIIEATEVTVSSRAAGNVARLYVEEGDRVAVGDTLLKVDDSDLELQARGLEAGVEVARAGYDLAAHGARREDIASASEAVHQAEINLESARQDRDRFADLYRTHSVTAKVNEDAATRYQLAERQLNTAQLNYRKLQSGSRSEDIAAAQARLEQAEAQLTSLQKKIADACIIAPIDGVVTERAVDVGEFVNIGSNTLTIARTSPMKLKIYVPENELGKVKLGQAAMLTIDTFKDRHYQGKVTYISPTAEFTPKNVQTKDDRVKLVFEVQIDVDNPNGDLKSGITADARLVPPADVTQAK